MTATAKGILRIYNNRHWLKEVVAGAGIGLLSTGIAHWIYPAIKRKFFKKDKATHTIIVPYFQNGGGGVSLAYNFNHYP